MPAPPADAAWTGVRVPLQTPRCCPMTLPVAVRAGAAGARDACVDAVVVYWDRTARRRGAPRDEALRRRGLQGRSPTRRRRASPSTAASGPSANSPAPSARSGTGSPARRWLQAAAERLRSCQVSRTGTPRRCARRSPPGGRGGPCAGLGCRRTVAEAEGVAQLREGLDRGGPGSAGPSGRPRFPSRCRRHGRRDVRPEDSCATSL